MRLSKNKKLHNTFIRTISFKRQIFYIKFTFYDELNLIVVFQTELYLNGLNLTIQLDILFLFNPV